MSTAISETVSERISKADFARPLQRRFHRRLAAFDIARNVLNHHDGVIHHEARQEIVSAISVRLLRLYPSRYITANVPTSDNSTAMSRE